MSCTTYVQESKQIYLVLFALIFQMSQIIFPLLEVLLIVLIYYFFLFPYVALSAALQLF